MSARVSLAETAGQNHTVSGAHTSKKKKGTKNAKTRVATDSKVTSKKKPGKNKAASTAKAHPERVSADATDRNESTHSTNLPSSSPPPKPRPRPQKLQKGTTSTVEAGLGTSIDATPAPTTDTHGFAVPTPSPQVEAPDNATISSVASTDFTLDPVLLTSSEVPQCSAGNEPPSDNSVSVTHQCSTPDGPALNANGKRPCEPDPEAGMEELGRGRRKHVPRKLTNLGYE
ncbi:hypothetical protein AAF712_010149 [Marasmius tenuissimus]|uniref:Uncharacterized protein n=1 Tax=Marasmius tenuissimus TaxID=585030 RepID=A0ABR2ZQL1_9AGAR